MSLNPTDVKNVILEEDDFGYEMRVGKVFADVAANTNKGHLTSPRIETPQHGGTYTDSVTGKPRQFDYRCQISISNALGDLQKTVILAVECKNLHRSSPLVVCGRPRTAEEAYHVFIKSEKDGAGGVFVSTSKVDATASLYRQSEFVGKSLVRLKEKNGKLEKDSEADIYDRWSQALASSVDLAVMAGRYGLIYSGNQVNEGTSI